MAGDPVRRKGKVMFKVLSKPVAGYGNEEIRHFAHCINRPSSIRRHIIFWVCQVFTMSNYSNIVMFVVMASFFDKRYYNGLLYCDLTIHQLAQPSIHIEVD